MLWSPEYLLADLSTSITFNKGFNLQEPCVQDKKTGSVVKVVVKSGVLENKVVEGKSSLSRGVGAMPKIRHIRSIFGSDNK